MHNNTSQIESDWERCRRVSIVCRIAQPKVTKGNVMLTVKIRILPAVAEGLAGNLQNDCSRRKIRAYQDNVLGPFQAGE